MRQAHDYAEDNTMSSVQKTHIETSITMSSVQKTDKTHKNENNNKTHSNKLYSTFSNAFSNTLYNAFSVTMSNSLSKTFTDYVVY